MAELLDAFQPRDGIVIHVQMLELYETGETRELGE